ncbi:Fungal transcriptional regulatory protein, N-terminal [Penicillium camemberti]|uniref:Fungal transcriptional regulatory protein, N-terminal n=1 Tax=Penicillium camemberti (strain FM 013) TaxID=1429867 RepID=A0A0G4PF06_PENC3|nr:Fungal transcriptional regulatory protein, N-terminal [Penicillium camemberti]
MGPRRSHRKSRNGCPQCKSRRLKCDEQYPCTNCVKHAIQCSYVERGVPTPAESPATQSRSSVPSYAPSPLNAGSYPATPAGNPGTLGHDPRKSESRSDLLQFLSDSPAEIPALNTDDWASDLELMHHYCTVTCNTLTIREDSRHVWRTVLPMEGYSNKYLMHGILALAALHRSCLFPTQKEKSLKASAYHQAAGLKEFRELISSPIDPSNWQPVFCFASMIMVYICASPIRLGEDCWPAPISNMVELFSVVKGLQTIMEPWLRSLRRTQLAPLVNCIWLEDEMLIPSPATMQKSLLPPDIQDRISQLHRFIDDYPFPHIQPQSHQNLSAPDELPRPSDYRADYKHAMKYFENSTRQIELAGPHVEVGMVLMWAYSLSKQFQADLEAFHPAALVLLSHWCVLLRIVDDSWFIKDTSLQLLEEIENKINPNFREWLVWPRRWVFGK